MVEVCSSWQSGPEKKVGHEEENLDDLDNGLELSKAAKTKQGSTLAASKPAILLCLSKLRPMNLAKSVPMPYLFIQQIN